jgi:hypothetical protein
MRTEKAMKYVGKKRRSCRLTEAPHTGNTMDYRSRSQTTTTPSSVDYVRKLYYYIGTIKGICLFSDNFYSDSTLILTTIAVKQCTDVGVTPCTCVKFLFIVFNVCLNSRRWFMLCLVFIFYRVLALVSGDRD